MRLQLRLVPKQAALRRRIFLRLKMLTNKPQAILNAIWPLIADELGRAVVHK